MSEVKQGSLRLDNSKRRWISFLARSGQKQKEVLPDSARISKDVIDRLEGSDEVQVHFERIENKIDLVRLAGQPWTVPISSVAPSPLDEGGGSRKATSSGTHAKEGGSTMGTTQSRFHNPYNFVPFEDVPAPNCGLGQFGPPGHHAYKAKLFEGRITVKLTATSPLLLLDPASTTVDKNDHTTLNLLTDSQGRPVLRPTSFKGALRSAYEAITGSRLGVFHGHDRPLARRMDARDGLAMMPARISDCGKKLELYLGTNDKFPEWQKRNRWQVPENTMYAAWLPLYWPGRTNKNGPSIDKNSVTYPNDCLPKHGDRVVCWLNLTQHQNPDFKYWRVVRLQPSSSNGKVPSECHIKELDANWSRKNHGKSNCYIQAEGYVCITNQNIKRKHDERVFFTPINHARRSGGKSPTVSKTVHIQDEWLTNWTHLIEDYQSTHEGDLDTRKGRKQAPDAFLGSNPGQTAWSRHVYEKPAAKLKAGDLCYARVDKKGNIVGLYPVMISRELASTIPHELVPQHLLPAQKIGELSAADRVFGWVRQGKDDGQDARTRSTYKGHLRIRKITCETDAKCAVHKFNDCGLPLAILSTPKPQQALFYAAKARTYDQAKKLSGRKFYPHHPHHPRDPESYWDAEKSVKEAKKDGGGPEELEGRYFREYIRRKGTDGNTKQRDSQNRSVRAWVNPDTIFEVELRFDNLNAAELGALLWLCNLGKGRHLKVGAGKPLGFGSVSPKIASLEIRDHAAKQAEYRTLVPSAVKEQEPQAINGATEAPAPAMAGKLITCPESAIETFVPKFSKALDKNDGEFESHPAIAAFLRMAEGPSDGAPVHYPRVRKHDSGGPVPPDPKGENYRWFVENQRGQNPCPLPAPGEDGLPYHKETQRGGGGRRR